MADALISRSQVLAGLLNRQASNILFQIEMRTALLAGQHARIAGRYATEQALSDHEVELAEAAARGQHDAIRPDICDLERFAPQWGSQLPDRPSIRAAIAHQLAKKYVFTRQSIPNIREALGLSDPAVRAEYERQFSASLDSIYAPRLTPLNSLRWTWARFMTWLEHLPPFWTIFAFTLTETVGSAVLALPIAVAPIGPLPGLAFIFVLGIVNMLTVGAMAEAVARNGRIRYGSAFIGRVVGDYLGPVGSAMLSISMFVLLFLVLMAYYTGLASALSDATGISPLIWVALAFGVGLFFITRKSLNSTIASALLIGAINIVLILILSGIGLVHLDPTLLRDAPLSAGFDASTLGIVFGVILGGYFGHLSVGYGARVVLARDPSSRSLILGAVAAQLTALVLNSLWVIAVNGSVNAEALASERGTALAPLAATVGDFVKIPGTLFAILGMGMASIHMGLGLTNLIKERLPIQSEPTLLLPHRRGSLRLSPRGDAVRVPQIVLVYLGLIDGKPHFRVDVTQGSDAVRIDNAARTVKRTEVIPAPNWQMGIEAWQEDRRPLLALHVIDASPAAARVRISTPLSIQFQGERDVSGLHLTQMGDLPEEHRSIIGWVLRQGEVTLADITRYLDAPAIEVRPIVEDLVASGYLNQISEGSSTRYRAFLTGRRPSALPADLWQKAVPNAKRAADQWEGLRRLYTLMRPRLFYALTLLPVMLAFLLVEWQFISGSASFTGLMGFAGAVIVPLLGGLFPVMMLAAARRRGDHALKFSIKGLGSLPVLLILSIVFFIALLVYGLILGPTPLERGPALIAAGAILALAGLVYRSGGFAPRMIIEVRQDERPDHHAGFSVTANGEPVIAKVRVEDSGKPKDLECASGELLHLENDCRLTFELPKTKALDLKVWVHRVTVDETSTALPAEIGIYTLSEPKFVQILEGDDYVLAPLTNSPSRVTIWLRKEAVTIEPTTMSSAS